MLRLLLVPIVALTTLCGLTTAGAARDIWTLIQLGQLDAAVRPPLDDLISTLQQERIDAARLLGTPHGAAPENAYAAHYAATDGAARRIVSGAQSSASAAAGLGDALSPRITALLVDLRGLPALRGEVSKGQVTWATAQTGYSAAIRDAIGVEDALASVAQNRITPDAQAAVNLVRGREMLARQAAVVAAADGSGSLGAVGYREFVGALSSQQALTDAALADLRAADAAQYRRAAASPAFRSLAAAQLEIETGGPEDPKTPAAQDAFSRAAPGVLADLGRVTAGAGTAAVAESNPYTSVLMTRTGAAVLLGMLAGAVSMVIAVRISRGLTVEIGGLRDAALDLADRRLPRAIERLLAGERVDPAVEVADDAGRSDEIGQVASAVAQVHRVALQSAVERADMTNAVAGVFLNLARRSQVLVHRQLALLDQMERRVEDPGELEDLFRLDHMATRMRRHAEGLIILSGAAPGRSWRKPVPLMDVLRAAVAAVEDYARVEVRRVSEAHVVGAAVADLTHLVSELVENATAFSPPHTRVQVQGEQVPTGYVIEIEDRGLGMGAPALAEANRRVASERRADLFDGDLLDGDRLGLFVVNRLARRHRVTVSLHRSAYGGTLAVVLIPKLVLELPAAQHPSPQQPAETARIPAAGGHEVRAAVYSPAPVLVGASLGPSTAAGHSASRAVARGVAQRHEQGCVPAATPPPSPGAKPRTTATTAHTDDAPRSRDEGPPPSGGLPRRVRQRNLAPQLRDDTGDAPPGRTSSGEPATRSPEEVRAIMGSFQHGSLLGRAPRPGAGDRPAERHDQRATPSGRENGADA